MPFRQQPPSSVPDFYCAIWQWNAAIDIGSCPSIDIPKLTRFRWQGLLIVAVVVRVNVVYIKTLVKRCETHRQRAFRHAVTG